MRRRTFLILLPLSLMLSLVCLIVGILLAWWLPPEHRRRQQVQWLAGWAIKGLLLPSLIWFLMNLGISWEIQPFMPVVQAAKNKGTGWIGIFFAVFMAGFFVISTCWAALLLIWTLARECKGLTGEARNDFKSLCFTSGLGLCLPAIGILALGGWYGLGMATLLLVGPVAGYAPGILSRKKMPPMYARAIARMKFGKYGEAETEIIRQLEQKDDDFQGWMMLAELYASQFNDVREAEQTVLEICDQPTTTPSEIGVALNRLADWQLKYAQDPDAARRALLTICERLRNTHISRMAQLRMNQLPRTVAELHDQQTAAVISMPSLGDQMDQPIAEEDQVDRNQAAKLANECAATLTLDPDNVPTRERFARLLAERLNKPELAIEQMTLLLNMPDQDQSKRAEWLSMTAAWHIRHRHDPQTGRNILERVLREFPTSPQALAARRRLQLLDAEART